MDRPARVQCSKAELERRASENHAERQNALGEGATFNLWHRKWAGGAKTNTHFRSSFRCNKARDSGLTKSNGPYFCVWFARGCCYKGKDCAYLHRIPEDGDLSRIGIAHTTDCFGRTKHAELRDDMGGIGSFLRPSSTLSVGRYQGGGRSSLVSKIRHQFQEWGEVESVKMLRKGAIALVKYKSRLNAEFAKEAMTAQTVTGHETLSIKWSQPLDGDQRSSIPEDRIREIIREVLDTKKSTKNTIKPTLDRKRGVSEGEAAFVEFPQKRRS